MRTLVVEDDLSTRRLVREVLERQGIEVYEACNVEEAMIALGERPADIVILDVTLPCGSGIEILTNLRQAGVASHVIVLSGASNEHDQVRAFELGADDYLVKPFSTRELTARVLAVRRRQRDSETSVLRFDGLEIDLSAARVLVHGRVVELPAKELALLAFLAVRPGHVFSRAQLLRAVWDSDPEWQSEATVTEHISRLRKKLAPGSDGPSVLHTVPGGGYRFDPPLDGAALDHRNEPGAMMFVGGVVVAADDAASELFGAPGPDALVGRHITDLISELVAAGSVDAALQRLALSAEGAEPRSQVLLFTRSEGRDVAVEVTTSPAMWDGRAALRLSLRRAVDESAHIRYLFTGVLSDLADAVIVTDMHDHIRSWNPGAERVYGWGEAEVLGRHINDVVVWAGSDEALTSARAEIEATGHWHGQGRQITRDGFTIAVQTTTNIVRDENGGAMGIVSVNRPVDLAMVASQAEPPAGDVADLRRGIAAGELIVHYQPIVDLAGRFIYAVEALVRWQHPARGLVGPDEFIPIAERCGLIGDIGAFVLEEACRQVGTWRNDGLNLTLAVNLSPKELADPGLVDRLETTASASGFDLHALWLEVTESALVEDVATAREQLHRLTALGVGISIDDFGTGWASLTYLREFPVHLLKIDRSFVRGIQHDTSAAAIASSIISLAAELKLFVVAEGIETEAEAKFLQALGCSIGQGYLFGHPTPAGVVDLSRVRPLLEPDRPVRQPAT
jgi:PAS domain S-box-containing protein